MIVGDDWSTESLDQFEVKKGDTLQMAFASSYLNYLLTNEVLILPQYGDRNGPMSAKEPYLKDFTPIRRSLVSILFQLIDMAAVCIADTKYNLEFTSQTN